MASVTHEAKVTVIGDARSLKKAMGDAETSVKKATTGIEKSGSSMAAGMKMHLAVLGAAVVAGLGKFVASSISAANDLNESINAVNVIFDESSGKIHDWAEGAAESMGMSQRAVNQAIIPIGAMLKNMGLETDEVAEKTMMLTERAVDLGSQLNVTADVAMEKFRAGLAGESEPLKAFGVDVSVAALTTEALKLGLIESGEAMDRNVRAQAAMSIIMKETDDAAGDFANTLEGSLSNQVKALKANVENMSARLGQKLLPVALTVTTAFSEMAAEGGFLSDVLDGVTGAIGRTAEGAANAISEFNVLWHWIKRLNEANADGQEPTDELRSKYDDLDESIQNTTGAVDELIAKERLLIEEEVEQEEQLTRVGEAYDEMRDSVDDGTTAVETLTDRTERLQAAEQELTDARLAAVNTELGKLRADQEAAEALEHLIEVQQDVTSSAEDIRIAELELAIAMEEARIATEKQNAELDRMDGKRVDVTLNWITTGATDLASKLSNTPGGWQLRAKGGPVRKGEPYVVGEEGPEAFVPDSSGTIIPFNRGSRMALGGGTVINLNVSALDPQSAARAVVEALQAWQRSNGAIPIQVRG